jgi:hypothetical protein
MTHNINHTTDLYTLTPQYSSSRVVPYMSLSKIHVAVKKEECLRAFEIKHLGLTLQH